MNQAMKMTRLNLGCGRAPMPGYLNVDIREAPGVDAVLDLDRPRCLWPIVATASIDEVKAISLFEHLSHWEELLLEIARVLRPGGVLEIRVPYKMDYMAYHVRHFDKRTFDPYRSDVRRLRYDLKWSAPQYGSLEFSKPYFTLDRLIVEHFYPFAWHVAKYVLGERAYGLPLGPRVGLHFWLRRNERPWNSMQRSEYHD